LAVPISIHLSEDRTLEAQVRRRYGSSVRLLEQTGLLRQHCVGVHCIYFRPEEVERLAEHPFGVAHCPASNLKLGEKLAPVPEFLKRGVPVGLGTDSVMSNDNLDILEEARLAALAHKGSQRNAGVLPGDLALQMATCMGAEAIGLGATIGRLQPGYLADLIVLETNGPHWVPSRSPLMAVLYAASSRDVQASMVNGEWIMRDRQLLAFDEEEVLSRARQALNSARRQTS
jgi:5-methylthioadenosine/S-adenosylhomocysteine deaminase